MRPGIRWVRWGIGVYAVVALACTAAWLFLALQAAERTGLRRQLFLQNQFGGRPYSDEISAGISLDFLEEDERLPRRRFGVRWRGYWYVPDDGTIEIHGEGDDRLNVHVDGELVLRRYPPEDMHRATGTITLVAGVHELLIEYEQEGGAYALDVRWSPPSDRPRSFGHHRLFHEPPSSDDVRLAQQAAWFGSTVIVLWGVPLLTLVLELTRFRGHLILLRGGGIHDAENEATVSGGIPAADGRSGSVRTHAGGVDAGV